MIINNAENHYRFKFRTHLHIVQSPKFRFHTTTIMGRDTAPCRLTAWQLVEIQFLAYPEAAEGLRKEEEGGNAVVRWFLGQGAAIDIHK
jgi:hypothetical protein